MEQLNNLQLVIIGILCSLMTLVIAPLVFLIYLGFCLVGKE